MDLRHPVAPALVALVAGIQGYDYRPDPADVHHGVPGPRATVIISFAEPLDLSWPNHPDSGGRYWLLASGLHTEPVLIHTHGYQHGIQLELTPLGSRVLLGLPIGALNHLLIDHCDLPLGIPADLHARMAESDWPERFRLLDHHLQHLACTTRDDLAGDLRHAWNLLERRSGRIRVDELATEIGWSRRHLVNRFTAEFGLPPREVARLHRFGAAQRFARTGLPFGEVAVRAGYADQAHFTREFRRLAGQTPTDWRAEVLP